MILIVNEHCYINLTHLKLNSPYVSEIYISILNNWQHTSFDLNPASQNIVTVISVNLIVETDKTENPKAKIKSLGRQNYKRNLQITEIVMCLNETAPSINSAKQQG